MWHDSENTTITSEPPLPTRIDPADPSWVKSHWSIVGDLGEVEVDEPL